MRCEQPGCISCLAPRCSLKCLTTAKPVGLCLRTLEPAGADSICFQSNVVYVWLKIHGRPPAHKWTVGFQLWSGSCTGDVQVGVIPRRAAPGPSDSSAAGPGLPRTPRMLASHFCSVSVSCLL